ncbi:NADH dehydrogenase [Labilithrix luteola]|uniref:NADH dehydrogenase n=1 Tax=Labilithrix luteola TaxID=1391654 RepID=A0A0K1PK09_9BACT|nr:FAD-dependent oxidoreductase [Labilithrix luteola]AKU93878.1 NADH dehydrogenase [Labilithrix luteola]
MKRRVLIVGGGYAGALSALRLARKTRKTGDVDVTLLTAEPFFVERIRLHQDVAGPLRRRTPLAKIFAGTSVQVRSGHVEGFDFDARKALVRDGSHESFDELVVATGSIASSGPFDGKTDAYSCASEADALALRARLETPGLRVVIVGGGLTGVELASELGERRSDLRVTLVTSDEVAPMLSEGGRAYVRRVLAMHRVDLLENEHVVAADDGAVILASGRELTADAFVWAGGFAPSPLAKQSGLAVDASGRAIVDARLRSTSHPFVRVIGDAARVLIPGPDGSPQVLRMACATAMPMGAYCADDVARQSLGPDFSFSFAACCVSLGRKAGVFQRRSRHDAPIDGRLEGRLGAFVKEAICRYTIGSFAAERRGFGYGWPGEARTLQVRQSPLPPELVESVVVRSQ